MKLPICAACTRNVQTVDTPNVKARVERIVVFRDEHGLHVGAHCHREWHWMGWANGGIGVDETTLESLRFFT